MAVGAPFDVDEALHPVALREHALLIFPVVAAVPAGPDGRRINIRDVARKVTATKGCQPGAIELMRQVAHLGHKTTDCRFIYAWILTRPVVFVAKSPENDGRMVIVLVDHVSEHVFRILLKRVAPNPGSAPRSLLPDQEAKLIAQVEHQSILLVMAEADKVCPHLADEAHFFANLIVTHCSRNSGVIGMALGAMQEQPFVIQLEGTVLDKFNPAYAEALIAMCLSRGTGQRNATAIKVRCVRRPKLRLR